MDRLKKLELIQRSLGLRHKLKVHETMKGPETHEELAVMLLAKWELEDELHAIEEILNEARQKNSQMKRTIYEEEIERDEKETASENKEPRSTKKKK